MCPGNRFEEKIVNRKKLLAQGRRFVYKPHLAQGQGLAFVQRPSVPGALPGVPAASLAGASPLPFQAPRLLEASCPKLWAWPFPGLSRPFPASVRSAFLRRCACGKKAARRSGNQRASPLQFLMPSGSKLRLQL